MWQRRPGQKVSLVRRVPLGFPRRSNFGESHLESRETALHSQKTAVHCNEAADPRGKKITLKPQELVVAPSNMLQAEVLLKSVLRAGTNNNDLNPVKSMGLLDGGQANLSRLTSNTAWWVQTDAPEGMKLLMRRKLEKTMEGDFETDSMRYKATERYDVGFTDWRAMYGTPGV